MSTKQPKRYVEIIQALSEMIQQDDLKTGDRLPSERELSDRLSVGRSSIREALRGLELLDIIETRRGEGTFMKAPSSYRLVDLLLSFLLKDEKAMQDLTETRRIIELQALQLACKRITAADLDKLILLTSSRGEVSLEEDYLFHETIVAACGNTLLQHLWKSLVAFHREALKHATPNREDTQTHEKIVEAIAGRDAPRALRIMATHLEESPF
ncbi:FadR/GntR family transcriptional regulator [Shouchella lonarensis]|uniref:Transcriptional regulator, GntR family n=1 Tax=Shouchella lonarensis TaxID=1464122 RepID=A0A1G6GNB1_9BACI|nr:FadR/GntR family transcriptional regulator [Shouchella lonarensis]SDB83461.1 transcriptional regulator, GntR family [Shouchella lonarensis]